MAEYFTQEEADKLAVAVGTVLGAYDRALVGDLAFSPEQLERIGEAFELISTLSPDEILYLFTMAGESE
ncbi:hypothetical protein V6B33_11190 [Mangrovibacillus sp. Mu-81]|uniref:hypothetical protein n=1 Tax=Mangrovibacillus sp. Mu-81 TaxID=3121478 RepID=UPI002FE47591